MYYPNLNTIIQILKKVKFIEKFNNLEGLISLKELLSLHPTLISLRLSNIMESTIPLILDLDLNIRTALYEVFEQIFPLIPQDLMNPFLSYFLAVVGNSLTHSRLKMRLYGLKVLNLLLKHFPKICYQYSSKILPQFTNIIRIEDVKQGELYIKTQVQYLNALSNLVSIIFHEGKYHIPVEAHSHTHQKTNPSNSLNWNEKQFIKFHIDQNDHLNIVLNILENVGETDKQELNTRDKIITFFQSIYTILSNMWLEHVKASKEYDVLRLIADILYKICYSIEESFEEIHQEEKDIYLSLTSNYISHFIKALPVPNYVSISNLF